MKITALAACALLLAAACSGVADDPTPPQGAVSTTPAPAAGSSTASPPANERTAASQSVSPGPGAVPAPGASSADGEATDPFGEPGEPAMEPEAGPARSAVHPAAGRYTYSQSGFERFCDASDCREEPLPDVGHTDVRIVRSRAGGAVLRITNRSSRNGSTTSTTDFSRRNALIRKVEVNFSYRGFAFSDSYEPRPAVRSLRFPLRRGASWSGRWDAETSGRYRFGVVGIEDVKAAGGTIRAAKIVSATEFHGDFEGRADVTVWIDPSTKAIVKTNGRIDLESVFGRYVSEFRLALRSGPRYG